jgi:hypothetical protein
MFRASRDLLVQVGDRLGSAQPHSINTVAREDPATGEEAPLFPVRQAQLGAREGKLPVHPPRQAVPNERRIHRSEEPVVR